MPRGYPNWMFGRPPSKKAAPEVKKYKVERPPPIKKKKVPREYYNDNFNNDNKNSSFTRGAYRRQ